MSMASFKPQYMYFYILKEDMPFNKNDHKELLDKFWVNVKSKPVTLSFYYRDWDYSADNFYLLYTPYDKLQFAYSCLFNDKEVDTLVKTWIPELEKIEKSNYRRGFPLIENLEKYNVNLEDFILNGRYIVVLDDGFHWSEMCEHDLIDFNKFTEETANQTIYA